MGSSSGTELVLRVGESLLVRLPCQLSEIAVDNDPWSVHSLGGNVISLEAFEEGRATLLAWCEDGTRVTYPGRVLPRASPPR